MSLRLFQRSGSPLGLLFIAALSGTACTTVKSRFAIEVRSPDAGDVSGRLVHVGGGMKPGDRYAVSVLVQEPLYLYVEQRSEAGVTPLLQGAPTQLVRPGRALLIPPGGFLKMGAWRGTTYLYVVASTEALPVVRAQFEIDKLAASGTSDARDGEESARGDLDERGIGVVRFKITPR